MARFGTLLYGVITYLVMFATFLYLFGFMANFLVPKGIDEPSGTAPLGLPIAALINLGLIALFSVPHSVMARPAFKQWWTRFVPNSVERTTYVLVSTLLTILLFWQWQPMNSVIWHTDAPWARIFLWGLYFSGIVVLMSSTFVINHFDLFGLRQVYLAWKNKPYKSLNFKVTFFYKFVRHPLYVGWLLIFWATPSMSLGHLLFAIGMSSYILIAIRYEERDLKAFHGAAYQQYQQKVPMLVPRPDKIHETILPASDSDGFQRSRQISENASASTVS